MHTPGAERRSFFRHLLTAIGSFAVLPVLSSPLFAGHRRRRRHRHRSRHSRYRRASYFRGYGGWGRRRYSRHSRSYYSLSGLSFYPGVRYRYPRRRGGFYLRIGPPGYRYGYRDYGYLDYRYRAVGPSPLDLLEY